MPCERKRKIARGDSVRRPVPGGIVGKSALTVLNVILYPKRVIEELKAQNEELANLWTALQSTRTFIDGYIADWRLTGAAFSAHKNYFEEGHYPFIDKFRSSIIDQRVENLRHIRHLRMLKCDYYNRDHLISEIDRLNADIACLNGRLYSFCRVRERDVRCGNTCATITSVTQARDTFSRMLAELDTYLQNTSHLYGNMTHTLQRVRVHLTRIQKQQQCPDTLVVTLPDIVLLLLIAEIEDAEARDNLLRIFHNLSEIENLDERRALFVELYTMLLESPELGVIILKMLRELMTFEDRMAMIYNAELNFLYGRFGGDQHTPLKLLPMALPASFPFFFWGNTEFLSFIEDFLGTTNVTEILTFLRHFRDAGCGEIAITNIIFTEFANRPDEFERIFGFPMFIIDGQGIRFNFEMLAVDIFKFVDRDTLERASDLYVAFERYFEDIEGVNISIGQHNNIQQSIDALQNALDNNQHIILYQRPTILFETDGTTVLFDSRIRRAHPAHAVTVTGLTDEGNIIVSTWGKEALILPSEYMNDNYSLYISIVTFEKES